MGISWEQPIAYAPDALEDARISGIAVDFYNDVEGVRLICNYRSQVWASVARLFLILASAQSAGGVSPAEVHTACEKFLNQKAFPISLA
jgi:hypothetical protein